MNTKKKETGAIQHWPLDKIIPYASNARKISPQAVSAVAGSIAQFGFRQPILVDAKGIIIAGHTRLQAAQSLELATAPVIVCHDLTEEQVRAYRLADNRVAEFTEWDRDILEVELDAIDVDLSFADFDSLLDEPVVIEDEAQPELTESEDVPEAKEKEPAQSQTGEIYELGPHRLMCGDSTDKTNWDLLLGGEKADMMFTDPPYGVNYEGGAMNARKREKLAADDTTEIYYKFLPVVLPLINGPCYMWYANRKSFDVFSALENNNVDVHACIIWHKTNATYAAMGAQYKSRHEPMVYFKPKGTTLMWCGASDECTLWEIKRDAQNTFHPTQKPTELAERALKNHTAKTILDPFAGSGSTLIACAKTNRTCHTMEISPHYCDVIRKRWTKFAKENNLEPGSGALE